MHKITIQKIWNLSHDLLRLALSASSSEKWMLAIQQLLAQGGSLAESRVVNRRWDPLFTRPFSSVRPSVGATTTDSRWVFGRRSSDFLIPVAALRILSISFSPMDPMLRPFFVFLSLFIIVFFFTARRSPSNRRLYTLFVALGDMGA